MSSFLVGLKVEISFVDTLLAQCWESSAVFSQECCLVLQDSRQLSYKTASSPLTLWCSGPPPSHHLAPGTGPAARCAGGWRSRDDEEAHTQKCYY